MILSFTGHRPDKLGGYQPSEIQEWVRRRIAERLVQLKPEKTISGMALGVDTWAAQECVKLGIPFIAAVPFKGQQALWPLESQSEYRKLLGQAAEVVYVCQPPYAPWKMQVRNKWMVDHSDLLLAVWDGTKGGTGNCVAYAELMGRQISRIDPVLYTPS